MPRARLLKPGFFTNDDLVELDFATRLLFAGLWTIADRRGRLEDRPRRIKIELFPADDVDVDAMLQALTGHGFIHRYTVGSQMLIHVRSFPKHQTPHHREPESTLPACDCEQADTEQAQGQPEASPGPIPNKHRADTEQAQGQPEASPAVTGNRYTVTGSGSGKPPRARSSQLVPLTDAERQELLDKWLPMLPDAADGIELALAHKAHLNYPTGQKRYVDNWLRGDWERRKSPSWADKPSPGRPAARDMTEPPPPTADQVFEWIANRPERYPGGVAQ